MSYSHLTKTERAFWDEYQTLRAISDWPGFGTQLGEAKDAARKWLVDQRKTIWRAAQPKKAGGDGKGWSANNRRERWEFLKDENLNNGAAKHEVRLPAPNVLTPAERVEIEAREGYLAFASTTPEQKARKQANVDRLVNRRKQLYRLLKDDGDKNGRQKRYDALCIATHHGKVYETWDKLHNKWGVPYKKDEDKSTRESIVDWCEERLGISENPAGSNKGQPQPSGWQERVYGDDGVPWCACFAVCSCWDNGVTGQGTAGCALNTSLAKQGRGIYRGFTTDPSRVTMADHFFIADKHTGVVRAKKITAANIPTYEGNTSPGSEGSQYNGGTTAARVRQMVSVGGTVTGFGLIRA